MAKFKITVTGPIGKVRPEFTTVVEAENAKQAQLHVRRTAVLGAKYLIEEVEERRPTLRAAQ
jgi:hypothetical protein